METAQWVIIIEGMYTRLENDKRHGIGMYYKTDTKNGLLVNGKMINQIGASLIIKMVRYIE